MDALILSLASKYPVVLSVIAVIGVLRVVVKPLISVARAYVQATSSPADDKILDSVEQSPLMKGFLFVIDWVASIKPLK